MLATTCAINCRYCFRREFPYDENTAGKSGWQELFSYLREHPEIDEVILSGGDPLAVNDAYLHRFIEQVSQIPSLKRIRIHTRLPVVIPQRVTQGLLNALTSTHLQTVMVIHANHANEIDDEVEHALKLLHRAGVTLLNQSVLLKNINDHADTLAQLSNRLFECQVLPYYLHQLDKVSGIHHFNVPLTTARAIMLELQSQVAGFLVPRFVAEIAGESSKTLVDLLHKNQ